MRHVLKVEAPYFDALLDGSKTFEVRRNDRAYQRGDVLCLYDAASKLCPPDCSCHRFKARSVDRRVTFVYSGDPRFGPGGGLQPGVVVLALAAVVPATTEEQK